MKKEKNVVPRGKLILIGGNEAKKPEKKLSESNLQRVDFEHGVLDELLMETGSEDPLIEVIPLASEDQEEMGLNYVKAFAKLKKKAQVLFLHSKRDANKKESLQRIEAADIMFFTGGDQQKILKILADTEMLRLIKQRFHDEDIIVAGSSSGAMVMGEHMITGGNGDEALLKGVIQSNDGLGMLKNVIIDTHFLSRGRVSRLAEALLIHNEEIGLGICEDTALVITEASYLRTIGSGTVVIMEGHSIKNTNYARVQEMQPVYIEHLTMHILANGSGYDLSSRRFIVQNEKKTSVLQEAKH